jgi:glycopeptide antibiotics resistance protein
MISRFPSGIGSLVMTFIWIVPVAFAAAAIVVAISRRREEDRGVILNRLVIVGLLAALSAVAVLTLQPLGGSGFDAPRAPILSPMSRIGRRDALDNLVLYLPVGFFAALWWRSRPRPVVWAAGLAFTASFAIEMTQMRSPINRAASIHDVMFNTLGGLVGAIVGMLVARMVRQSRLSADASSLEFRPETS